MFRAINLLFVTTVMFAIWAGPGLAFQLFGSDTSAQSTGAIGLPYKVQSSSADQKGPAIALGNGGDVKSPADDGVNIWIPGLGVVGQMPKLDFGLEMLYGASPTPIDAPRTARELDNFESEFAIKGTIKRKF